MREIPVGQGICKRRIRSELEAKTRSSGGHCVKNKKQMIKYARSKISLFKDFHDTLKLARKYLGE